MTYPNAAAGLKSIYQAKLVGLISIVLVIIPIVQIFAVAALLGTHYLGAVLGAVVLANLFSLATGCIALTIDASRPILHWQTEQQVMKQNMNQMICMLVVLLVALIPVAGVVGMMVLSSAAQDMEAPSMLMRFAAEHASGLRSVVAALLMAAEAGVSILILHKVGEKRFSAIEP